MTTSAWGYEEPTAAEQPGTTDLIGLGRRIRSLRKDRGLTLAELADRAGTAASQLSVIENGRREPRLSLLQRLADVLGSSVDALLGAEPGNRREALEIQLERAQRSPFYEQLGLPTVRVSSALSTEVLEALVGLQDRLAQALEKNSATPEEARRANVQLRRLMREQDNYFPDLEQAAKELLALGGYSSGPVSNSVISEMVGRLGYSIHHVTDLPHSTRSVTDLLNRRIYLVQSPRADHDPRAVLLQAVGHQVLGHEPPKDYAGFLAQRVQTNYFAAAVMLPEDKTVPFLLEAKKDRDLFLEDLKDRFAVSHETAGHRFTNLATRHLGIRTHFHKVHSSGVIHKAYENDGLAFPTDHTGAIEGQISCRKWSGRTVFDQPNQFTAFAQYTDTPSGTYWCSTRTEHSSQGVFSIGVGVAFTDARWFRGRDTPHRTVSACPDPSCCRRPPEELSRVWAGHAWPNTRAHSHVLAALPEGAFPGVDEREVYEFLHAHDDA
ncbi:helix-turn-helix domain-containing protein [Kocuria kalidii]|uniref:helix-turn-helix domain-containing protein n=1 Tax=Kocuria kalidii TaxID=3376283 RepID=UPI0037B61AAC